MPRLPNFSVTRAEVLDRPGRCRCRNRAAGGGLFCAVHGGLAASRRAVIK